MKKQLCIFLNIAFFCHALVASDTTFTPGFPSAQPQSPMQLTAAQLNFQQSHMPTGYQQVYTAQTPQPTVPTQPLPKMSSTFGPNADRLTALYEGIKNGFIGAAVVIGLIILAYAYLNRVVHNHNGMTKEEREKLDKKREEEDAANLLAIQTSNNSVSAIARQTQQQITGMNAELAILKQMNTKLIKKVKNLKSEVRQLAQRSVLYVPPTDSGLPVQFPSSSLATSPAKKDKKPAKTTSFVPENNFASSPSSSSASPAPLQPVYQASKLETPSATPTSAAASSSLSSASSASSATSTPTTTTTSTTSTPVVMSHLLSNAPRTPVYPNPTASSVSSATPHDVAGVGGSNFPAHIYLGNGSLVKRAQDIRNASESFKGLAALAAKGNTRQNPDPANG